MRPATIAQSFDVWRIWLGSAMLRACWIIHVLILVICLVLPAYRWNMLVLLLLVHLCIAGMVLTPCCKLFGENLTQLPHAARARGELVLTFDDGPDPSVTPKVLDLLDAFGAKASFFVIGERVRRNPEIAAEIVARGHSLENHTLSHSKRFSLFGVRRLYLEINDCQDLIARIGGQAPRFVRPTAGFSSPLLVPLLKHLGLRLATWTRRGFDTREQSAEKVLQRLCNSLAAGDILLLHDAQGALDAAGEPVILKVLPLLLERIAGLSLKAVTLPQACDYR